MSDLQVFQELVECPFPGLGGPSPSSSRVANLLVRPFLQSEGAAIECKKNLHCTAWLLFIIKVFYIAMEMLGNGSLYFSLPCFYDVKLQLKYNNRTREEISLVFNGAW